MSENKIPAIKYKKKQLVYLSSPYTKKSPSVNALYASEVYRKLVADNIVTPYAPLLAHYVIGQEEVSYDQWMDVQANVILRCDAIFTFNVHLRMFFDNEYLLEESKGRDMELKFAKKNKIPIFYDIDKLYFWAKNKIQ